MIKSSTFHCDPDILSNMINTEQVVSEIVSSINEIATQQLQVVVEQGSNLETVHEEVKKTVEDSRQAGENVKSAAKTNF